MKLTCPHCDGELEIRPVGLKGPAKSTGSDITPLTNQALRDVYDVIAKLGPTKMYSSQLYQAYLQHCQEVGRKVPLTKNSFGRALRANGAEPFRTATGRGFVLFEAAGKPATMTPEARERFEAAHLRQGMAERRVQPETHSAAYDEVQARIDAGLPPF